MKHPLFWLAVEGTLFTAGGIRSSAWLVIAGALLLVVHVCLLNLGQLQVETELDELKAEWKRTSPLRRLPGRGSSFQDYDQ